MIDSLLDPACVIGMKGSWTRSSVGSHQSRLPPPFFPRQGLLPEAGSSWFVGRDQTPDPILPLDVYRPSPVARRPTPVAHRSVGAGVGFGIAGADLVSCRQVCRRRQPGGVYRLRRLNLVQLRPSLSPQSLAPGG